MSEITAVPDVIDALVGIQPGSRLDGVRSNRPEARAKAQQSYLALFEPDSEHAMTREERFAVAAFVSDLHQVPAATDFYGRLLVADSGDEGVRDVLLAEAAASGTAGPYGRFRLEIAPESVDGPEYVIDGLASVVVLGERLVAALEHAHFLVLHPRDASRARLQVLLDAGWTTDGIVTLSQLIAFLSFQIRVVAGLSALAADIAEGGAVASGPAVADAEENPA